MPLAFAQDDRYSVIRAKSHSGPAKVFDSSALVLLRTFCSSLSRSISELQPVSVMQTAGEGGPYGMALLCAYALWRDEGETLEDYLDNKVFGSCESVSVMADPDEVEGFNKFIEQYKNCLDVEKLAIERF